jgi:class 3 adenylate cyclase
VGEWEDEGQSKEDRVGQATGYLQRDSSNFHFLEVAVRMFCRAGQDRKDGFMVHDTAQENTLTVVRVKYVFLDVVGFTKGRPVEAQAAIITALNSMVLLCIAELNIAQSNRILIPTGDGICIALIKIDEPFDLDIQLACLILKRLYTHNSNTGEITERFQVRIGINANQDFLVKDVNGHENVAGKGINIAKRVMDAGSGNQIVVSAVSHEFLQSSRKYFTKFERYNIEAKHQEPLTVYQYKDASVVGLTTTSLEYGNKPPSKLPRRIGFYLKSANDNRAYITKKLAEPMPHEARERVSRAISTVLWLRAYDSEQTEKANETNTYVPTCAVGKNFEVAVQYYSELLIFELSGPNRYPTELYGELERSMLAQLIPFNDCFQQKVSHGWHYVFVSREGCSRLEQDWPDLFKSDEWSHQTTASAAKAK